MRGEEKRRWLSVAMCLALSVCIGLLLSLGGCAEKQGDSSSSQPADEEIVQACREYIEQTGLMKHVEIDYNLYEIKEVTESIDYWTAGKNSELRTLEPEEITEQGILSVRVGDTSAHDFACLIVQKNPMKVLGYLPID